MPLEVTHHRQEDAEVVTVRGKATLGIGDNPIHAAVKDLLSAGARRIVVDLSTARAIDSSGVGELVSSTVSAIKARCVIVFARPSGRALKILEITGLVHAISHFRDVDEALAAIDGLSFDDFLESQRLHRMH